MIRDGILGWPRKVAKSWVQWPWGHTGPPEHVTSIQFSHGTHLQVGRRVTREPLKPSAQGLDLWAAGTRVPGSTCVEVPPVIWDPTFMTLYVSPSYG